MQISSTSTTATSTATATTQQLAVQCTRCTTLNELPPYVDLLPPTTGPRPTHKPTHCPRCGNTRLFRVYDYADVVVNDYFGVSRPLALEMLSMFRELGAQSRLPSKVLNPTDLISSHWGFRRLLSRQAIAPLTVSCSKCAGTYTMLRCTPDLHQTPPLYCIWCGSKSVHTTQDSTEEAAWLSLANHYNLSVQATQFFYQRWSELPTHSYPTFKEYLSSPNTAPIVSAVQQTLLNQQTTPVVA